MLALGLFDLLKGLDFEETIITWRVAVGPDPAARRASASGTTRSRCARRSGVCRCLGSLGLPAPRSRPGPRRGTRRWRTVATETVDLLRWQHGPDPLPPSLRLDPASTCSSSERCWSIAYVIFRPLDRRRARSPSPAAREVASNLVRAHGTDTLAFFKLRADKQYLFSEDRRAFVGYTIENGVLLLSGDPVGPDGRASRAAARGARRSPTRAAEARRARRQRAAAARCTRSSGCARSTSATRRSSSSAAFSLEGRPIRKVRQSVTRLSKAGLRGRAVRAARARPSHARARSSRWSSAAARARPSAASRWRWTRSGASTTTTRWSCSRATAPARSAASCTSCPATAGRRCRCRSCAAIRRRPTG